MHKLLNALAVLSLGVFATHVAKADTCNGVTNNLVQNCSFETGDFTGWTGTTTTDINSVVDSAPNPVYAGNYAAALGAEDTPTTLTQALATVAGNIYTIKFALENEFGPTTGYTNSFSATFGGATLFSETAAPISNGFVLYTFTSAATSSSTLLSFTSRNDAAFFDLDSISVAGPAVVTPPVGVTPEPSSFVLLGTGLLGAAGAARRRFVRA